MKPSSRQRNTIHYVIIGNSVAGIAAAQEIRRQDPGGRITILSDEKAFG